MSIKNVVKRKPGRPSNTGKTRDIMRLHFEGFLVDKIAVAVDVSYQFAYQVIRAKGYRPRTRKSEAEENSQPPVE